MYQMSERSTAKERGYTITSRLSRDEARGLAQELERAIQAEGRIRVLFEVQTAPYGDFGALWEDLKFDLKHARDIERAAVVGDGKLQKVATKFFDAISSVDCRHFPSAEREQAWAWIAH
ncbi:MAG: STAS/SEC14 domain-containing protein [Piscinibacter sp.]|nr:STAS/SEC14 domain-containing protein [Piscinibacter sp.]